MLSPFPESSTANKRQGWDTVSNYFLSLGYCVYIVVLPFKEDPSKISVMYYYKYSQKYSDYFA